VLSVRLAVVFLALPTAMQFCVSVFGGVTQSPLAPEDSGVFAAGMALKIVVILLFLLCTTTLLGTTEIFSDDWKLLQLFSSEKAGVAAVERRSVLVPRFMYSDVPFALLALLFLAFHTVTVVGGGVHGFLFDAQGFIAISTFGSCMATMSPWFVALLTSLNMILRMAAFFPFFPDYNGADAITREVGISLIALAATFATSMSQTRIRTSSTSLFVQSRREERRSSELLKHLLPRRIAVMLLRGWQRLPVDLHRGVALIFTDIVGFTTLGSRLSNAELVHVLNELFEKFDALADKFDVFKVEVVGDAWLGAAGLRGGSCGFAATHNAVSMALRLVEAARSTKLPGERNGHVQIRVGLHVGEVVGALIGATRVRYHLFGADSVIANRFESACSPNRVLVSGVVRDGLLTMAATEGGPREFCFDARGVVDCNRFGKVPAFLVSHCAMRISASERDGFADCVE
jgi:class 3 adenylate cyclase